jgi:hypothetical protein
VNLSLLLPVTAAGTITALIAMLHRRLTPEIASFALGASLASISAAALPTLWIVSLGFIAHESTFGSGLRWCAELLGVHRPLSPGVGIPALALSCFGVYRTVRVVAAWRTTCAHAPGPVLLVPDQRAYACTLPGRGGRIVISSALDQLLDRPERAVVLAHERAHARYRHDRYLLIADLSVAIVPFVSPIARHLRFCLERWADEQAVAACGDRHFVARTLTKVALGSAAAPTLDRPPALAFGGLGVPDRVSALLAPAPSPMSAATCIPVFAAVSGAVLLAGFQLHHLIALVSVVCPG